jgi:streptogrisin B
VTRIFRTLTLALLVLAGLLTGTAQAVAKAPAAAPAAEGVGCASTKACTTGSGGALMMTTRNSCTAGLPVRSRAGLWYLVTAGHCVAEARGATWRQAGVAIGVGTRWEYGGKGTEGKGGTSDVGVIKLRKASRSQVVVVSGGKARIQRIVGAKDARTGERVCVTAGRTGVTRCGTVVQTTTALSYPSPGLAARTIKDLALVKGICVNPGDSGSPVYAGSSAVGIAVARSATGCYTWYAKLPAQLRHFGLRVA